MTHDVEVSVIIPNLHSPIVDRTIESILAQKTHLSYEVIVVGMDKFNLVTKFNEVRFINTDQPVSAGKARNIGIQEAIGEKLLFIDSDCIAMPLWIATFLEDFDAGWKVIGGSVLSPTDDFWQLVYNLSMFHEQLPSKKKGRHRYLATLNLAVHKDVINKVGQLNEELERGQDVEWTSRMTLAGYDLLFDPNAEIEHHPPRYTFEAVRKDNFRSGYYSITVRHKFPKIFHMPAILNYVAVWKIFKPMIAGLTMLRIVFRSKEIRQHPKIIPYIYKQKTAWCDGAINRLEEIKNAAKSD